MTYNVPGVPLNRIFSNFLASTLQIQVQITVKVFLDRSCQVARVFRSKYESRLSFDNFVFQRTHVSGKDRQAEAVPQKQNTTLIDMTIRQNQNICRFEIQLSLGIWDVVCPQLHSTRGQILTYRPLDRGPISFVAFWSTGDDQAIIASSASDSFQCRNQIFEPFVWSDVAKEQNDLLATNNAQTLSCFARREPRIRNSVIDPERNDSHPCHRHIKLIEEFTLQLLGMNKGMIRELVLDPQCEAIEVAVPTISFGCINIVRREDNFLSQTLVVSHQDSSVEQLELVVPKNMKYLGLSSRGIADQPCVIGRDPQYLCEETDIRSLVAS